MTPLERNRLLSVLNTNGFHAEMPAPENWVGAEATFAPGRCYATVSASTQECLVATSLPAVANALLAEGFSRASDRSVVPGIPDVPFRAAGDEAFHRLVRRMYQLARALPTAPLNAFEQKTRGLPAQTEAERLVIQRIGQNIFRDALIEYWSGACAATGIDQLELLRASHCKPWKLSSDADRLDVHNGLLLVADVDAAFDCGLISFSDDGAVMLSPSLRDSVRLRFPDIAIKKPELITPKHREFLSWHRLNKFRSAALG